MLYYSKEGSAMINGQALFFFWKKLYVYGAMSRRITKERLCKGTFLNSLFFNIQESNECGAMSGHMTDKIMKKHRFFLIFDYMS